MAKNKGLHEVVDRVKKSIDKFPDPYEGLTAEERAYQIGYREGQKTAYHLLIDSSLSLMAEIKDVE